MPDRDRPRIYVPRTRGERAESADFHARGNMQLTRPFMSGFHLRRGRVSGRGKERGRERGKGGGLETNDLSPSACGQIPGELFLPLGLMHGCPERPILVTLIAAAVTVLGLGRVLCFCNGTRRRNQTFYQVHVCTLSERREVSCTLHVSKLSI